MSAAEVPAHVVCWGAFAPSRQSTKKDGSALARLPVRSDTPSLRNCSSLHADQSDRMEPHCVEFLAQNDRSHEHR